MSIETARKPVHKTTSISKQMERAIDILHLASPMNRRLYNGRDCYFRNVVSRQRKNYAPKLRIDSNERLVPTGETINKVFVPRNSLAYLERTSSNRWRVPYGSYAEKRKNRKKTGPRLSQYASPLQNWLPSHWTTFRSESWRKDLTGRVIFSLISKRSSPTSRHVEF